MTSLPPMHRTISSVSEPGSPDRDSVRVSDSTAHFRRADAAAGDAYQGHGHEQDWWSRLSNTQADMLRPLSVQLFEKLDDALFDRSGSSFQQFFEGMRVLRKNREALIQGWFDRLDEAWKSLRPQAPGSFRPRLVSAAGAPVDANGGFSLVDDVTLERKLAIESSIARGASLCRMELPPLCHRLTVLRKGAVVEADEVPAAPALLVQTFAKSLDEVPSLPVEVALVVFKLFDRVVVSTVEAGCKELNRILVQGGVVPQWNWSPAAAHRAATARSNRAMPAAPAPQRESWEDPSWLETVPALGPIRTMRRQRRARISPPPISLCPISNSARKVFRVRSNRRV